MGRSVAVRISSSRDMSTGFGIVKIWSVDNSGARRLRSAAIAWLTAITAPAVASVCLLVRRFDRMYGITDHAAGNAAPARGRTHRLIIEIEHAGHNSVRVSSTIKSDQ